MADTSTGGLATLDPVHARCAERLIRWRRYSGRTVVQTARELGVSRQMYRRYERGEIPSLVRQAAWCASGVIPAELIWTPAALAADLRVEKYELVS